VWKVGGVTLEVLEDESAANASEPRMIDPARSAHVATKQIGAKAMSLVALQAEGLPVPPFFCVTTVVFDELFSRLSSDCRLALTDLPQERRALVELAARVREELLAAGLQEHDRQQLYENYDRLLPAGGMVSVRSSALGEDSAFHSFAGQFDTYLCVTRETLLERVLDCMASAFTDRALFYRGLHGLDLKATRMGVVVQEMVDSHAAGVAFTADPTSGRTDRVMISAGLGLGSGVVDGSVPTDLYLIDELGAVVERTLARKTTLVRFDGDHGQGTVLAEVEGPRADSPALSDEQALAIADLARMLAERRGCPQDIEWALRDSGELQLLQARPITTLGESREQIFDNSNLVESYPGLTTPLTFSLMRRAYKLNFLGLIQAFGGPPKLVESNADVFENLVGLLDGRMYYNLSNWYRMFLQVPGVERALPAFEKAMGFTPAATAERSAPTLIQRLRWLPVQARILSRLLFTWVSLGSRVSSYETAFEEFSNELAGENLERLDAHELLDRVDRYSRVLFWRMAAAPTNDFFTQQLYGLLGYLIGRFEIGDPVALRNELLCGETGMKSVEPVRSLVGLAERIRAEGPARDLFQSGADSREVWAELARGPALAGLHGALELHVQRYGDRSLGELKLETVTLAEDPTDLITILRNYLRGGKSVEAMETRERAIRSAAEARVRRQLLLHPLRAMVFAFVLSRCRWGLKARESVRFTRGRMAGLFRKLYRALGRSFVERGLLDDARDLLMLTETEVADAIRGGAVTRDLRALVALRKGEYEAVEGRRAASRVQTRGIVLANSFEVESEPLQADRSLEGVGCSPGRVRAKALVVETPSADMVLDGEILIAETTDPGWVFLMVAAGGLISEKGNVLSHTAIIGRELGIPTIVGVEDVTRLVPHGATVELDGRAGTVTVELEQAPR
jgi:rifampicin phosphotransferase